MKERYISRDGYRTPGLYSMFPYLTLHQILTYAYLLATVGIRLGQNGICALQNTFEALEKQEC